VGRRIRRVFRCYPDLAVANACGASATSCRRHTSSSASPPRRKATPSFPAFGSDVWRFTSTYPCSTSTFDNRIDTRLFGSGQPSFDIDVSTAGQAQRTQRPRVCAVAPRVVRLPQPPPSRSSRTIRRPARPPPHTSPPKKDLYSRPATFAIQRRRGGGRQRRCCLLFSCSIALLRQKTLASAASHHTLITTLHTPPPLKKIWCKIMGAKSYSYTAFRLDIRTGFGFCSL
jgi:hypothetical protein